MNEENQQLLRIVWKSEEAVKATQKKYIALKQQLSEKKQELKALEDEVANKTKVAQELEEESKRELEKLFPPKMVYIPSEEPVDVGIYFHSTLLQSYLQSDKSFSLLSIPNYLSKSFEEKVAQSRDQLAILRQEDDRTVQYDLSAFIQSLREMMSSAVGQSVQRFLVQPTLTIGNNHYMIYLHVHSKLVSSAKHAPSELEENEMNDGLDDDGFVPLSTLPMGSSTTILVYERVVDLLTNDKTTKARLTANLLHIIPTLSECDVRSALRYASEVLEKDRWSVENWILYLKLFVCTYKENKMTTLCALFDTCLSSTEYSIYIFYYIIQLLILLSPSPTYIRTYVTLLFSHIQSSSSLSVYHYSYMLTVCLLLVRDYVVPNDLPLSIQESLQNILLPSHKKQLSKHSIYASFLSSQQPASPECPLEIVVKETFCRLEISTSAPDASLLSSLQQALSNPAEACETETTSLYSAYRAFLSILLSVLSETADASRTLDWKAMKLLIDGCYSAIFEQCEKKYIQEMKRLDALRDLRDLRDGKQDDSKEIIFLWLDSMQSIYRLYPYLLALLQHLQLSTLPLYSYTLTCVKQRYYAFRKCPGFFCFTSILQSPSVSFLSSSLLSFHYALHVSFEELEQNRLANSWAVGLLLLQQPQLIETTSHLHTIQIVLQSFCRRYIRDPIMRIEHKEMLLLSVLSSIAVEMKQEGCEAAASAMNEIMKTYGNDTTMLSWYIMILINQKCFRFSKKYLMAFQEAISDRTLYLKPQVVFK